MTLRRIVLWRGWNSPHLAQLLSECWESRGMLITCPRGLEHFDWIEALPEAPLEFHGDWSQELKSKCPQPTGGHEGISRFEGSEVPVAGVFSSGTLGSPRLALYSKRNIESSLSQILSLFQSCTIDSIFCYPQASHTFGLTLGYFLSLLKGWKLVTGQGKYSTLHHRDWCSHVREGTLTLGTPVHFFDLLNYVQQNNVSPPRSATCIIGGAPVTPELWRRVREHLKIENPSIGYGCTEAAPGVTHLPPGIEPLEWGDIGWKLPDIHMNFDSLGYNLEGPNRCVGIVQSRRNNIKSTSMSVDWNPHVHIRDRFEERADGRFIFKGRTDLQLNRGGEKFSLENIEQDLFQTHGIRSICVALPDDRLGFELGVLFSALSRSSLEIQNFLKTKWGRLFQLKQIQHIGELPSTPNGKPDRELAFQFLAHRSSETPMQVNEMKPLMPHRSPMVWIDEVLHASLTQGTCRVNLDSSMHYSNGKRISSAVIVEWLAQACGFAKVSVTGKPMTRAFLAGIRNLKFLRPVQFSDRSVLIEIEQTHSLPPLSIVSGRVMTESGELIAYGHLHVFSEENQSTVL